VRAVLKYGNISFICEDYRTKYWAFSSWSSGIPSPNLEPMQDDSGTLRGVRVAKLNVKVDDFAQVEELHGKPFPALYEFDMEMRVVSEKIQVTPKSIKFISALKVVSDNAPNPKQTKC